MKKTINLKIIVASLFFVAIFMYGFVSFWPASATTTFQAYDISGDAGPAAESVMGDVDGDGDLDIYVSNNGQNKLWINDGSANFTANDISGDTAGSLYAVMGDVDGDGDLDIYVANSSGSQNKLWINDGSANFTANDISGDTADSSYAAMGDVDGDGDLDIYVANSSGAQNKLWINDGSANFTANDISGDTADSVHAAMGDFDGDTDLDIYVANYNGGQNKLWINDGSANFTANDISGDTDNTEGVAIGDVDGDGDLDVYLANYVIQTNKLWINDGSANFTASAITGDTDNYSADAEMADFDGDGDLDIYVANYISQNRIWFNDGTGAFTAGDIIGDAGNTGSVALGDVNGDGGVDIHAVNYAAQGKLWINDYSPLDDHFVTTWRTNNTGTSNDTSITIPTTGSGYNYDVDWDNDGVFDEFGLTGNVTHDFGVAGTYTIRIRGDFPRIYFNNTGDRQKILSVDQWGNQVWASLDKAFYGATNIQILATDAPDLSGMTNLSYVFQSTYSFNQDISHWDVSGITDMTGAFYGAFAFNQPLNSWDVSNVTNMTSMFNNSSFNGTISPWDVSNVTSMSSMFATNAYFNQDISGWNVSSVTNPSEMFYNSTAFNQPLNSWDTSSFGNTSYMFFGATSFNQDLNLWNTASTTSMAQMFYNATSFNGDISTWDVSNVTNMRGMFEGASNFNGDISTWDTSSVSEIWNMFKNATSFDQDLGGWDVADVTNAYEMFNGVTLSTSNYDSLLIGWNSQLLQNSVYFDGGNSLYCAGTSARSNMISSDSWIITDGGGGCPSEITYDTTTFVESVANDGTISTTVTLTLSGDTFTTTSGPMAGTLDYAISNVPSGLTFSVVGTSSTTATVTLTGSASAHEDVDDISNLGLEFTDAAFTGGVAAGIVGYSNQSLIVDFNNAASLSYSTLTLREESTNDGSITGGIEITLTGDTFTNPTSTLTLGVDYTIANVPLGLTMVVAGTSATTTSVTYTGNAIAHENINDLSDIELTFLDAAFASGSASLVGGYSNTGLGIDFADAKALFYSTETFIEDTLNDGAIETTVILTLTGDTFATSTMVSGVHYDVVNVPAGLTVEVIPASPILATVTLTGSASAHEDVDDISNLGLEFTDAAFTGGVAMDVAGYSNPSLSVDFENAPSLGKFPPKPTCELKSSAQVIEAGDSVTLTWEKFGTASQYYWQLQNPLLSFSKLITTTTLTPASTVEYVMAVVNIRGANYCNTTVVVEEVTPQVEEDSLVEEGEPEKSDPAQESEDVTQDTGSTEADVCGPYLNGYIKINEENDPAEVMKLEKFLNIHQGENLPIDGIYDRNDFDAVVSFQERYRAEVLDPWKLIKEGDTYRYVPDYKNKIFKKLSRGTGYVYISTQKQINYLYCRDVYTPVSSEVVDDEVGLLEGENDIDSEDLVASANKTPLAKFFSDFFKKLFNREKHPQ